MPKKSIYIINKDVSSDMEYRGSGCNFAIHHGTKATAKKEAEDLISQWDLTDRQYSGLLNRAVFAASLSLEQGSFDNFFLDYHSLTPEQRESVGKGETYWDFMDNNEIPQLPSPTKEKVFAVVLELGDMQYLEDLDYFLVEADNEVEACEVMEAFLLHGADKCSDGIKEVYEL